MSDLNKSTANDVNELTLRAYQSQTQVYIDSTPKEINDTEAPWIDQALRSIPQGGKILELGSGFGRNADNLQSQGHFPEYSDAVDNFVHLMQQKGLRARKLDILKDDIRSNYDMIFANGVLVHFDPVESTVVLNKVFAALNDGGVFAFSVRQGEGSEWSDDKLNTPRYFYYWQPEQIQHLVENSNFEIVDMTSGLTSNKKATWLYIIARKVHA